MTILDALLHGVSIVGNTLDTPGALVRNTLSGRDPFAGLNPFDAEGRASGRDMLESWGMLDANQEGLDFGDVAGFGAELLTDPLNLLGIGAASKLRSPARHAGGIEKILDPIASHAATRGRSSVMDAMKIARELEESAGDNLSGILREIPRGSEYLGAGTEAIAMRTPDGDVLRIAVPRKTTTYPDSDDLDAVLEPIVTKSPPSPPPPSITEINQPTRYRQYGDYVVSRAPMADEVLSSRGNPNFRSIADSLKDSIQSQGYIPSDVGSGNIGLFGGTPKVIDYGAVQYPEGIPHPGFSTDPSMLPLLAALLGHNVLAHGGRQ